MERTTELQLIRQCLAMLETDEAFASEESSVPVACYQDPARFEAERALMRGLPHMVAHTSQLPSDGSFLTRSVMGTPVLLTRQAGQARAFINVCRHRGMTVERNAEGRCKRFVCPYHAWTYDLDGSLAHVRHADGFPSLETERPGLVSLPCFEAGGFVWVQPTRGDVSGPDASAAAFLAELESFGSASGKVFKASSKVYDANWKLIVDGGLESYHFRIAHKDTIAPFFPDNRSVYEARENHIRSVLPRRSIEGLRALDEAEWNIRLHSHVLYSLFPNASVMVQDRHFDVILAEPVAVDKTRIDIWTVGFPSGGGEFSEKATRALEMNHAITSKTLDEDFVIAEEIQRGMATGANDVFRLASFEGALTHWHRTLEARLSARLPLAAE